MGWPGRVAAAAASAAEEDRTSRAPPSDPLAESHHLRPRASGQELPPPAPVPRPPAAPNPAPRARRHE